MKMKSPKNKIISKLKYPNLGIQFRRKKQKSINSLKTQLTYKTSGKRKFALPKEKYLSIQTSEISFKIN
jgi:hypothetical protein